jgi:hypothetical protein
MSRDGWYPIQKNSIIGKSSYQTEQKRGFWFLPGENEKQREKRNPAKKGEIKFWEGKSSQDPARKS